MKKNLLQLLLVSCATIFTFSNVFGQSASCDTLYNYNNGDQLKNFSGDYGTALGHDKLSDGITTIDAWAEPYSVTGSTQVRSLYFAPWKVYDQGGSVTFKVYQNASGVPGAALATETVDIADFTKNTYFKLDFTNPATVNGDFFVGFELNYNSPQDSFAVSGTNVPGGTNYTIYKSGGTWKNVEDTYTVNGDPFVSAWEIRVLCSNAPTPTADFTVNAASLCLGGSFIGDAIGSTNADYYLFILGKNNTNIRYDTQEGVNVTLTPTVAGLDHVMGVFAHGGCRVDENLGIVRVYEPVTATNSVMNAACGNANGSITVTNSTGGSGSYSYTLNNGSPQSNATFNNVPAGSHTVTVKSPHLGCSYPMSITVGGTAKENITVNPVSDVCAGESVALTASGNGTIEWFDGSTSLGNGTSKVVTPNGTKTYMATLTAANGCTDTKTVMVTANPVPTVSAGSNTTICAGEATSLTASGASSYSWNHSLGNGATHSVSPTSGTTYEVTGTDANGCENTAQVTINVNALPSVSAGSDVTICEGVATTLAASGATSYTWNNSLGTGATHSVSPTSGTTYEVTGTDANGCENTDQVIVNVKPAPFISAGSDVSICAGGSTTITATGGVSYAWDNGLGASASHSVSPTNTTPYVVTGTGTNGCTKTSTVVVTVNSVDDASFTFNDFCATSTSNGPTNIATSGGTFSFVNAPTDGATISASTGNISNGVDGASYPVKYTTNGACPSTSTQTVNVQGGDDPTFSYANICLGNGVTALPDNISTPGGTFSFVTTPTDGATINSSTGEVVTPAIGSSYAIKYTTPAGVCQAEQVKNVTVYIAPMVNLVTTATAICLGESTTLTAQGDATSYTWNNGLSAGGSHTVSPIALTTYTVTGTDANGCTNTASEDIVVNTLPVVSAGGDVTVCENSQANLTATGASFYTWDNGLGNGASHVVTAISTETYTVTGKDGNNCENTDQVTVTVTPAPTVDAGANTSICSGDQFTLTASGANTYSWDNTLGAGAIKTVSPTVTTTYTVTGTDLSNCTNTDQIVVTVNAIPSINAGVSQTVCEGSDVTLTANSSANSTISWNNNVVNGVPFTATTSTSYTATADLNGCTATDQVIVNVNAAPLVSAGNNQTTCINYAPIELVGSPVGGTFSGNGVSNNTFNPEAAGEGTHTLTFSYTDGNGCENTTTIDIVVDGCASVEENKLEVNLTIKPNPASSYIEIETTAKVKKINMISSIGQHVEVKSFESNKNTTKLDVNHLVKGVYFIVISLENENIVRKVIVQ